MTNYIIIIPYHQFTLCIDEYTEPFPTVGEVPAREASCQGIRIGLYEVTYATS